ncbi:hypothetical protein [Shewanella inventionis]|uniref:hypothetical protein n=1 Tax=Shewanella inventionis TaxID=1738770 RepID=UPI0016630949|nr:hypothetical protein [Shewanella inventionis]MCL1159878.1 hypothetical protein [Shewanella inventionis]
MSNDDVVAGIIFMPLFFAFIFCLYLFAFIFSPLSFRLYLYALIFLPLSLCLYLFAFIILPSSLRSVIRDPGVSGVGGQ